MSFVVAAALAIGLFVAVPVLAHLLRRGRTREEEFPPAALVPKTPAASRQRSHLEDRALLALRSAMILALALLGATPLVQCGRLSLARDAGASVALALVVDDSLSMRAVTDGRSRWSRALVGARQLLASAREGDAVAVILAGRPARVALAATTDLRAARETIDELEPSDRATDIDGAVRLARAALRSMPHEDRRVVLLSDLSGSEIPPGEPAVSTPLPELHMPVDNCGIVAAEQQGRRVLATVACTSVEAARGRELRIVVEEPQRIEAPSSSDPGPQEGGAPPSRDAPARGEQVAARALTPQEGEQTISLEVTARAARLEARLHGEDALPHDDAAPVAPHGSRLAVAVVADPASASALTGGPTVVEQALAALGTGIAVRPLPLVPDDPKDLAGHGAVVIDDPPGLSPEARAVLVSFVQKGGVALGLLGPQSTTAQLAATLEPFALGNVRWEPTSDLGVDASSLGWLGPEAASLSDLVRTGRTRLDGAVPTGARVAGRWSDGIPWMLERRMGRGLVMTLGVPASVDHSDLALRPAFLALLEHLVRQAELRAGSRRTPAGMSWTFPASSEVTITGPEGALDVRTAPAARTEPCPPGGSAADDCDDDAAELVKTATPTVRGRYTVDIDGEPSERIVVLEAEEIASQPRQPSTDGSTDAVAAARSPVDASAELAWVLLALLVAELVLRFTGVIRRRRDTVGEPADAARSALGGGASG